MNMMWKVAWEDLQSTKLGARGQFGSRFSLGRMSLAEMVKFKFITPYTYQVVKRKNVENFILPISYFLQNNLLKMNLYRFLKRSKAYKSIYSITQCFD